MHRLNWSGARVTWDPEHDSYGLAVALTIDPPEVAAWLDANLDRWLRSAFESLGNVQVSVQNPTMSPDRPPTTQVVIFGLSEPFPDPGNLAKSVEEAIAHAEQIADIRKARAEQFESAVQQYR